MTTANREKNTEQKFPGLQYAIFQRTGMALYLDTLSWFWANQSLLVLLSWEATNTNFI